MSDQTSTESETPEDPYRPGTFVKGDVKRVARRPAQAVQFIFDGFKRESDEVPELPEPTGPEVTEPKADAPKPRDPRVAETKNP